MVTDTLILMERFIQGTLTDEEADCLLVLLEKEEETRQLLQRNMLIDFLLHKNALMMKDEQFNLGEDLSWDDLVRLQNKERPISAIVAEKTALFQDDKRCFYLSPGLWGLLKKCVWPNRWDLEESIAPVVTLLIVLTVGIISALFLCENRERPDPITTIARINETVDAVWEVNTPEYRRRQLVDQSLFQLKSGIVQLEMNNGVTVIFEGPSKIEIKDSMNLFCYNGKVSVHVSPAGHGFTILTPHGRIVDEGTEFSLNVSKSDTQFQVVAGKVSFITPKEERLALHKNEMVRYDLTNQIQRTIAPIRDYVKQWQFNTWVKEKANQEKEKYTQETSIIDQMPDLLVRLDMNKRRIQKVQNSSIYTKEIQPLEIRGSRVGGVLYETHAVSFHKKRDGLVLTIPKTLNSLTMEAVVQVNLREKRTHVLCSSSDLVKRPGAFLWQFTWDGALQLQYKSASGTGLLNYTTVPCLSKEINGTWVHVRIVMDAKKKRIIQYLNGKPIPDAVSGQMESSWQEEARLSLNNIVIGNYFGQIQSGSNRSLDFPLAEFRLYKNVQTTFPK